MWMWDVFNAMVSLVMLCCFGFESILLLPSPTTASVLPRQGDANDVLNVFWSSSPIRRRQTCSKTSGIGEQSRPVQAIRYCEYDYDHINSRISSRNYRRPAIRRIDNVTTAADKSDTETTPCVSPSFETLDVGGSAATRSTVRTSSSRGELTATSFYAASASDLDETSPLTPAHLTTDAPSNIPAETDVTTTRFSSAITQAHASVSPSGISPPSSEARPFPPSTTEPSSTSLISPASSETPFTWRQSTVLPVTSSTHVNSSINILSIRGPSTTSLSSPSPTSIWSATAGGSSVSNLLPITGTTTTTSSPSTRLLSSTSTTGTTATVSCLSTHLPGTSSTVSLNSTHSTTKTCHTRPPSSISTTSHSTMTTNTTLPSTILSSTIISTSPTTSSSTSSEISLSSTSDSSTQTYYPFPSPESSSSATSGPDTTSAFLTTSWPNTTPVIAPSPTSTSTNGTSSTSSETGSLRTDTSQVSTFARNTGAIIGVSLAATTALVCLILLLFFTCRRYRRPRVLNGSTDNILTLAREVSWRRPVDGDDDSYMEKARAFPPPGSLEHSADTHDAFSSTSAGEHISSGHGSAESGKTAVVMPMSTVFGGQPPMPGLDQSIQGAVALPPTAMTTLFPSEPHNVSRRPSNPYRHIHTGGTRSAASLTLAGGSTSSREGSGSLYSTEDTSTRPHAKHRFFLGPRPVGPKEGRRHSSTPPTAFMGMRQPLFDYERQPQPPEQSDRMSVKSFISRLRNGRRASAQSMSTVRRPSFSQSREGEAPGPSSVAVFSPSLLNPPVTIIPPHPVLTFPRGVTGNSYHQLESQTGERPQHEPSGFPILWPPATLPPSPSPTDNSSMAEGLLHPRLSLSQGQSHQASLMSLRDHEDYTRPINGLVNNHLRSTTTFDTQDTTESEEARDSIR